MEYLEGGFYISGDDCRGIVANMGLAAGADLIAIASSGVGVYNAVSSIVGGLSGPVGVIAKAVLGIGVTALSKVAYGIGYGADTGNGVNISFTPDTFAAFVKMEY